MHRRPFGNVNSVALANLYTRHTHVRRVLHTTPSTKRRVFQEYGFHFQLHAPVHAMLQLLTERLARPIYSVRRSFRVQKHELIFHLILLVVSVHATSGSRQHDVYPEWRNTQRSNYTSKSDNSNSLYNRAGLHSTPHTSPPHPSPLVAVFIYTIVEAS